MRINYVFTGEEERDGDGRYIIPDDVTHASIDESVKVIPAHAFFMHENIVELICHDGVEKIEAEAFYGCSLKRLIMRGVKIVERYAFCECGALTYVECRKLEIIGEFAFDECYHLGSISLISAKVLESNAFSHCEALEHATFGKDLESIGHGAFYNCPSLERIAIPLKHDLITGDDIFTGSNLNRVDIVDVEVLYETIAALQLEEWGNDMRAEIDSINEMLPDVAPGEYCDEEEGKNGGKARAIQWWITSVLYKINHYKEKHRNLLDDAARTLEHALPKDIVMKNVLPFLELPSTDVLKERMRKRQRDEA